MSRASDRLLSEIERQIAWLQQALALWPTGEGSSDVRSDLVRELEDRLGLLALLTGRRAARA